MSVNADFKAQGTYFSQLKLINKKNEYFLPTPIKNNTSTTKTNNIKKTADITATTLWLASVAFCIYKTGMFRPNSTEHIIGEAQKIKKQYTKLERMSKLKPENNIDKSLENLNPVNKFFTKSMFKLGESVEKTKAKMGDELYNNLINSIGKVVIMPLIILANPFGKKKTDKNEKASVIIREPLSVFATFTLQGAFDKMFNVYMPKVINNNILETNKIQQKTKNNQKLSTEDFLDIKYNDKEAKRLFIELANTSSENGGLKGIITQKQAEELLTLKPTDSECYESYIKNFERLINEKNFTKENFIKLKNKYQHVAKVVGNNQLAKINPKIAMNIVTVVILSRIFLNVIYGKTINLLNLNKPNAKKEDKQ